MSRNSGYPLGLVIHEPHLRHKGKKIIYSTLQLIYSTKAELPTDAYVVLLFRAYVCAFE